MKRACLAAVVALVMSVGALAQSAEQEVIKTIEALATAAREGDKATTSKILGDDLRWIDPSGVVTDKTQRLALLKGVRRPRALSRP
jgi:hypothetical protein